VSGLSLNRLAANVTQAEIRAMSLECDRLNGINLAQGICDTEVPEVVRTAAKEAVDQGFNSYTRFDGLGELRRAVATKMARYNAVQCDSEAEITICAGATGALYCVCLALFDPGDEVILFEPFYGYHRNTLESLRIVPSFVTMRPPGWLFERGELERAMNMRTRAIIVNSPGNPSGKVFDANELEIIAAVAEAHDLFVITDEIYEYFVYDGRHHISICALPGMAGRTITISGWSKTFSITGWRIGYSVSSRRWAEAIGNMNDLLYVCAPAPLQYAVARGVCSLPDSYYSGLATSYSAKRDKLCEALREAGLTPNIPQGAYYVLADVGRLPGVTSKAKAMHLLERTGVAGVPGDAFFNGDRGRALIRLCYAKNDSVLEEACNRLARLD
jgi:aminotransferase